jgi:hypothetical protein
MLENHLENDRGLSLRKRREEADIQKCSIHSEEQEQAESNQHKGIVQVRRDFRKLCDSRMSPPASGSRAIDERLGSATVRDYTSRCANECRGSQTERLLGSEFNAPRCCWFFGEDVTFVGILLQRIGHKLTRRGVREDSSH